MVDPDIHARDPNDPRYTEKVADIAAFYKSDGGRTFDNLPSHDVSTLRSPVRPHVEASPIQRLDNHTAETTCAQRASPSRDE